MLLKGMSPRVVNVFTIALILFLLYTMQYALDLRWQWLFNLQSGEFYKRWSGLILALFITFQWILTLTRVVKKWRPVSIKITHLHKWIGALSPILLYIHSMRLGYAYLFAFSILFMLNMLLGTINLDILKTRKDWVFQSWMIVHVGLSVLITFLMFFHIGMVFYYQ